MAIIPIMAVWELLVGQALLLDTEFLGDGVHQEPAPVPLEASSQASACRACGGTASSRPWTISRPGAVTAPA
jgi:hypothetical protein